MQTLEMEETEGLVSVNKSNVGSGNARLKRNNSLWEAIISNCMNQKSSKKPWICLFVSISFVLIWMGAGNSSSDVVENKNNSKDNGVVVPVAVVPDGNSNNPVPQPQPNETPPPPAPTLPPTTPEPFTYDWRIPQLDYKDPYHNDISNATRDYLANKYGQWHFWDGDADMRPNPDFLKKYKNMDVPGMDFPDTAWQVDAVYVNHFLNDGEKLVSRAMEAIFAEYGHGKPLSPEQMMERMRMFHWDMVDYSKQGGRPPNNFGKRGARDTGGWTTSSSYQGLVRRLLHAMMTQDTFTVVLGGHSAAAGAGNHFRQSYIQQFHKIMFPVFARLGVKLITRNISQGGLGTIQAGMGSGSIYGNEVDLLIWDSGMTENANPEHIDLFLRQGLIGGNRVPVLWGGQHHLLQLLNTECDADVGEHGKGTAGIITTENETQAETIPWAARYMKCSAERQDLCGDRFRSTCWIDRPDNIQPEADQYPHLKQQVKWHPGWRPHQLEGRVIAFALLKALQTAINTWSDATMSGQPLDDSYWHVTDYYENIRQKVKNLDPSLGDCYKIEGTLPKRMCHTPMKGRTQSTPRANFDQSGITSILKPAPNGYIPKNKKVALYDGPDVHNPNYDVPEGEVDVLAVVMNRRRQLEQEAQPVVGTTPTAEESLNHDLVSSANNHANNKNDSQHHGKQQEEATSLRGRSNNHVASNQKQLHRTIQEDEPIVPGLGWEVFDEPQGTCDGEYLSVCGRSTDNPCVLEGKHDARGAVLGCEYSGWLVMNLDVVQHGIIVIKLHTWHWESENPVTQGWTSVNNEEEPKQQENDAEEEPTKEEDADNAEEAGDDSQKEEDIAEETPKEENNAEESPKEDAANNAEDAATEEDNNNKNDAEDVPKDRYLRDDHDRSLMRSYSTPDLPDTFYFDYAIQGKITSLNKTEFMEKKQQVQRVVETLTLLDDEGFEETENVEVAIRMRGCGRQCVFGLSHIYWA